jgi:signal transduction histidine kinase
MRVQPVANIRQLRVRPVVDIGLVGWMLAAALFLAANWNYAGGLWRPIDPIGYVLIVAFNVPLLWRRQAPVAVLIAVCAATGTYLAIGYYHSIVTFAVALAIFSVATYRCRRTSIAFTVLAWSELIYAQRLVEPGMAPFGMTVVSLITVVSWAFGDSTRRLAERGSQLAELTSELRREQQERAHRAVSQEQSRIARELHDVVAHHMSVISVQAGLGRYVLTSNPDTARRALEVIAGTAHEALTEMRRMLAVLRVSADELPVDAPFDPAPGLSRLAELIERVRMAGATVELRMEGDAVALPSGMDLCVYRVIQESLTNVLKHAKPPAAMVALSWQPHQLTLTVTDDGRAVADPAAASGAGTIRHGLIGMSERARIYGGSLHTGRRPEGGFEVVLTLPIEEPST